MINKGILEPNSRLRITLIVISVIFLGIVFLGQRFNYSSFFGFSLSHQNEFIFNRSLRFLINDNLVLLIIYALFYERKYVKFGLLVEGFGFCFLLIPYFLLRFYTDLDHMIISFLHRLIINPTLMLLIIPAIYLQKFKKEN